MGKRKTTKAIAKRQTSRDLAIIVGVLAATALVYFIVKSKKGSSGSPGKGKYENAETWDVKYNDDGLPENITIHREATRS